MAVERAFLAFERELHTATWDQTEWTYGKTEQLSAINRVYLFCFCKQSSSTNPAMPR